MNERFGVKIDVFIKMKQKMHSYFHLMIHIVSSGEIT